MSTNRTKKGATFTPLKKGPNGRNLCRQCEKEVKRPRITFCSDKCVDAWRLLTDPNFMRSRVRDRDKGVCATCGLDTKNVKVAVRVLRELWHGSYVEGARKPIVELVRIIRELEDALGIAGRSTFWDADHIKAVVDGGGECGLENIQTLCLWCHRQKTAALAARRAAERKTSRTTGAAAVRQTGPTSGGVPGADGQPLFDDDRDVSPGDPTPRALHEDSAGGCSVGQR